MASLSPARPSRRTATRRKLVVDDSDEEMSKDVPNEEEDDNDFTPAPKSPKRTTRRKTTEEPTTPRANGRARRTRKTEVLEPTQVFHPEETVAPEPVSPTKKPSPRKRKSAAPTRKGRASVAELPPPLPTPRATASPEPSQIHGTPLADITHAAVNGQPHAPVDTPKAFVPVKSMDMVLEKPMDIVIRSRALGVPPQETSAGPTSRTVIQYLVLTNFKSYAGRQEVGPFHASFSSVVGPNGSGKSNVIDSLLFVFGFRASKMRQGKISALIHNSAKFPNLDHCEVEVHFQEVRDLVGHTLTSIHAANADHHLGWRWPRSTPRFHTDYQPESIQEQREQILHQQSRVQLHHCNDTPERPRR